MKKTAFFLMVITIIVKISGFAREIILSFFYGASYITDAYIVSLTIPNTILAFIGIGISTTYIPIYSRITKEKGIVIADRYTSNIINSIILLCTFFVIIAFIFSRQIVMLFASGFQEDVLSLTTTFTRINILCMFFSVLIYVFTGYLNIKDNFYIPALVALPYNFLIILSIFLSYKYSIFILPLGFVLAEIIRSVLLLPYVLKKGYRHTTYLSWNDEYLKSMILLLSPVIIGVSMNQMNVLVDRTIASQIIEGGISSLNYSNRLILFIQGIFVLPISTTIYPVISKMAANNDLDGLKKVLRETLNIVNLLVIPSTIGLMLFAEPIVIFLFGRGAFNYQAIQLTTSALFFYSIGIAGFGLREILSRIFFSINDTKTPMINASIGMLLNIILNITLSRYLGIGGLALATSISATFTVVLMFIALRRKIGVIDMKNTIITFIKIVFASLLMGFISKLVFIYLTSFMEQTFSLIMSIGLGVIVYFITIYFLKIEDVYIGINYMKTKVKSAKI